MRPLNETDLRSLIGLLDDEDPRSLALVREQILGLGAEVIPYLQEAHDRFGPAMRGRVDGLLAEVRLKGLEREFLRLSKQKEPDLEAGAFLIARFAYPDLAEAKYRDWLDKTAASIAPPPGSPEAPYPLLHRLNVLLFEELKFAGNEARYYDPANSFLNRVIDSRLGIPISLSILYLLLARRLGLPVSGAGLPGHFMIRFEHPSIGRRAYFVDPFNKGRMLTRNQCRQFLLRSGYTFREEFLKPTLARETLARMMRNLISIYQRTGMSARADRMSTLVELLLSGASSRQDLE